MEAKIKDDVVVDTVDKQREEQRLKAEEEQ
jgi:hypothetical protein